MDKYSQEMTQQRRIYYKQLVFPCMYAMKINYYKCTCMHACIDRSALQIMIQGGVIFRATWQI